MGAQAGSGRENQRRRTRQNLLDAAARLSREGRRPTLEEVAEAALVSRATAYRYFANVEALLVEAALDIDMPTAAELFTDAADDPVERMLRLDGAVDDMIARNETPLRLMLANALQHAASAPDAAPARQNRRTPLIEAALQPARARMPTATYRALLRSLALLVGTESMVVFRDVLRIGDREARQVKRWAIRALIEAALRETRT